MPNQPFKKIVRSFQWLHIVSIGGLSLALLLAVALYWGGQRIVQQESEKVRLSFMSLTTFLDSQERFLEHLQALSSVPQPMPGLMQAYSVEAAPAVADSYALYKVRLSPLGTPFTISCKLPDAACTQVDFTENISPSLYTLGHYLVDAYTEHWSRSYFPGARTILLDTRSPLSLVIPALDVSTLQGQLYVESGVSMMQEIRAQLLQQDEWTQVDKGVQWRPVKASDTALAAVVKLDTQFMPHSHGHHFATSDDLYVVSLSTIDRTQVFQSVLGTAVYDQFWLSREQTGRLLGQGDIPGSGKPGVSMGTKGLVLTLESQSKKWIGVFRVSYATLMQANLWLPGTALSLLLMFLAAVWAYVRWYSNKVLLPAETAQQALVESELFNRTVLDTAPVALCVFTLAEGKVVFSNSLARQWLALSDELGTIPAALLSAISVEGDTNIKENSLEIQGHFLQVVYAFTKYKKQPVVLCALTDISERIEYEAALSRAKSEADNANAAKTRFLAAVSHEVRTPLYGILATLELMLLSPLREGLLAHLMRLQQSSNALMQLISDILDVTKIEANQLVLVEQAFNPAALLYACVDHYTDAAARKHLLLFAVAPTDTPAIVLGDADRIRQILNNFISNAIKFTQSGQVIVRLRNQVLADGRVTLSFQVSDTGIGIPADAQAQLFKPFYQVENSGLMAQGTGLGLNICANLAALMKGDIYVTSEPGLGSSFTLELSVPLGSSGSEPLPSLTGVQIVLRSPHAELSHSLGQWLQLWGARATVWDNDTDMPMTDLSAVFVDVLAEEYSIPSGWQGRYLRAGGQSKGQVIGSYSPFAIAAGVLSQTTDAYSDQRLLAASINALSPLHLHVLVAEDNPINQATLRDQLEQLACTARIVDDGREALNYWQSERFDAVLTDVNMPNMNGYELTQAIRQSDTTIPILGVTANATRHEEQRCKAAGMSAWLVKPMSLEVLHSHLKHWCHVSQNKTLPPVIQNVGNNQEDSASSLGSQAWYTQAVEELQLVPDRHRQLYKDSMWADAQALLSAAEQLDTLALRRGLHRLLGALLAMQQKTFAHQVQLAQAAVQDGDIVLAAEKVAGLAQDLQHMISTHLPA